MHHVTRRFLPESHLFKASLPPNNYGLKTKPSTHGLWGTTDLNLSEIYWVFHLPPSHSDGSSTARLLVWVFSQNSFYPCLPTLPLTMNSHLAMLYPAVSSVYLSYHRLISQQSQWPAPWGPEYSLPCGSQTNVIEQVLFFPGGGGERGGDRCCL